MPQLVKSLFMLSKKLKRIPKVKTVHVGRAGAYSALAWFRQRRHMAGRQWEDKMFQTQASKSLNQEQHSHCPAEEREAGRKGEIDGQVNTKQRYTRSSQIIFIFPYSFTVCTVNASKKVKTVNSQLILLINRINHSIFYRIHSFSKYKSLTITYCTSQYKITIPFWRGLVQ